ncbi:MAG: hypothetical protein Q8P24_14135 [Desulfobacterales bacterium]|nr:hypothetical protein [Desulfobacterales bacterium]
MYIKGKSAKNMGCYADDGGKNMPGRIGRNRGWPVESSREFDLRHLNRKSHCIADRKDKIMIRIPAVEGAANSAV